LQTKLHYIKFVLLLVVALCCYEGTAQYLTDESPNKYKFKYKSVIYKGTRLQITSQLRELKDNSWFINIPEEKREELTKLFIATKKQAIPKFYKKNAILFLDGLYDYEDFLHVYDNALISVINDLKRDMRRIDFKFERQFTKNKVLLTRTIKEDTYNIKEIDRLKTETYNSQIKLISHRWMKKKMDRYHSIDVVKNPNDLIKEFKKSEAMQTYLLYKENRIEKINSYLQNQIIDFYYKKSLPEIHVDNLELNYISKL